jgi:NADPH-dependent curcumin reductase CurA
VHETVSEGLENAPAVLQGLFTGKNKGKAILKVADAA